MRIPVFVNRPLPDQVYPLPQCSCLLYCSTGLSIHLSVPPEPVGPRCGDRREEVVPDLFGLCGCPLRVRPVEARCMPAYPGIRHRTVQASLLLQGNLFRVEASGVRPKRKGGIWAGRIQKRDYPCLLQLLLRRPLFSARRAVSEVQRAILGKHQTCQRGGLSLAVS